MFDLNGKTIVITGGSGVLGSAIADGLAQAGAHVIILARTEGKIRNVVQSIQDAGGSATGYPADVLDKSSMENVAAEIEMKHGQIDILINGAGGNSPDATAVPGKNTFFDLPQDAMKWVFDLNLMGTILPSQVFGQGMTTVENGVILNISSMAAYQPLTRVVSYAAAKAALNNFTQWLAVYMATEHSPNIRVNAIAPGFFVGQQNRYLLYDEMTGNLTARGQQIINNTPMGRFGEPEELIGAVNWLVSDSAKFVTGIVVPIDGGFSAFSGV
jgi:NAD(P)-dependent dehydrogenase (short-subunit alcohol dehydrogenase family)